MLIATNIINSGNIVSFPNYLKFTDQFVEKIIRRVPKNTDNTIIHKVLRKSYTIEKESFIRRPR